LWKCNPFNDGEANDFFNDSKANDLSMTAKPMTFPMTINDIAMNPSNLETFKPFL